MNNIIETRALEPNEVVSCLKIDITQFGDKDKPFHRKKHYIGEKRCWAKHKNPFLE